MTVEKISPFSLLISAAGHLALGISLLFYPEKVWKLFIWLVPLFLFSAAVVALLNIPIGHGHKKRVPVSTAVSYAVLGLAVAFFPWMITRWLAV